MTAADIIAAAIEADQLFIEFFIASHKGCQRWSDVTRIEWRYLDV